MTILDPDPPLAPPDRPERIPLLEQLAHYLAKAESKHAPMQSGHEGYAVILEELDELWAEVKRQTVDPVALRKEAFHVAAMGLRFIKDICGDVAVPARAHQQQDEDTKDVMARSGTTEIRDRQPAAVTDAGSQKDRAGTTNAAAELRDALAAFRSRCEADASSTSYAAFPVNRLIEAVERAITNEY